MEQTEQIKESATTVKERDPSWLAGERERQLNRLIGKFLVDGEREVEGLDLHKVLGLSKEEYSASIPPIPHQPEKWHGRFDIPVLIDPRISLNQLLMSMEYSRTSEYWEKSMKMYKGMKIPNYPYWIWTNNGRGNCNISFVDWWKRRCAKDERGDTIQEVLFFFYLQEDHINQENYWPAAPGSIIKEVIPGQHRGAVMPFIEYVRQVVDDKTLEGSMISAKPIYLPQEDLGLLSCGDWQKVK